MAEEKHRTQFELGMRVQHSSGAHHGTVRYVGPIPELSTEEHIWWLGIEWDGAEGKNDGSVKGTRYFTCQPNCGSFIRLKGEVNTEANTVMFDTFTVKRPLSLAQALYMRFTEQSHSQMEGKMKLTGADPFLRDEATGAFVNVKRVDCRANDELSSVGFAGQASWMEGEDDIAGSGSGRVGGGSGVMKTAKLGALFPFITDLVMSSTLLAAWEDVFGILHELPNLKVLNLSDNPLGTLAGAISVQHPTLTSLNISNTHSAQIGDVTPLLLSFPAVEILLCCNLGWEAIDAKKLRRNQRAMKGLFSLTELGLAGNSFRTLQSIAEAFAPISSATEGGETTVNCLKILNVSKNPLDRITEDASSACSWTSPLFPQLKELWMRKTNFPTWSGFLLMLPCIAGQSLTSLSVSDCPFFTATDPMMNAFLAQEASLTGSGDPTKLLSDGDRRKLTLMLLPDHVTRVNNSDVSKYEREVASTWTVGRLISLPAECLCEKAREIVDADEILQRQNIENGDVRAARVQVRPRFCDNTLRLRVFPVFLSSTAEFMEHRASAFSSVIRDCEEMANGPGQGTLDADVRWTVEELERATVEFINMENYVSAATHSTPDAWASVNTALNAEAAARRAVCESDGNDDQAVHYHRSTREFAIRALDSHFPPNSLLLVLVDQELAANPGACKRGMHVKPLLRPWDPLHEHRPSHDDMLLAMIFS